MKSVICLSLMTFGIISVLTGCVRLTPEQEQILYFSENQIDTDEIYKKEVIGVSSLFRLNRVDDERIMITGEKFGAYDSELDETQSQTDRQIGDQIYERYVVMDEDGVTTVSLFIVVWEVAPKAESIHWKKRSFWYLVSYPVWGLPRDLIDAPFTQMKRWNFDLYKEFVFIGPRNEYEDFAMLEYLEIGGLIVGGIVIPVLIAATMTPLWVSVPLAVLTVIPGAIGGIAAGVGINEFLPDSLSWMARNIQAPVLRLNVDSEDFFPNWKFGVHEPIMSDDPDSFEWKASEVFKSRLPYLMQWNE